MGLFKRQGRRKLCAWAVSAAITATVFSPAIGMPGISAKAAAEQKLFTFGTNGSITSASVYSADKGYGFTDISYPQAAAGWVSNVYQPRVKQEASGASNVTDAADYLTIGSKVWTETGEMLGSDKNTQGTFRYDETSVFNIDLTPADYDMTVMLANPTGADVTVKVVAEDLMKASVTVPAGSGGTKAAFLISQIDTQMNLKFEADSSATERDAAVTGYAYVKSVQASPRTNEEAGSKPTVYIASDSTVQTYDANEYPKSGWGQMLYKYFTGADNAVESPTDAGYPQSRKYETSSAIIENRAIGGRSSKSFIDEGKLDSLLSGIKQGDYLFVQWGHNDATYTRPNRYVSSGDFATYIQKYIDGCKERGATCVLVTPVPRYSFTNGVCSISFAEYRNVMLKLAQEQNIPLLDLGKAGADFLTSFGENQSKSIFLQLDAGVYPNYPSGIADATHYQEYGAIKMAKLLAGLIKQNDKLTALAQFVPDIPAPEKVPAKPADLKVITVGSSTVKFKWDAVEGAELYYIYRAVLADGQSPDQAEYTQYGTSVTAQYTDKGCEGGKSYAYRVSAINEKGESEKSDAVTATTKSSLYKYDFTGSGTDSKNVVGPTLAGWTQVKADQMYDKTAGYGFITAPGNGRTRGTEGTSFNDMECDFCLGSNYEFAVDLPNGDYSIKAYAGDIIGSSIKTAISGEGKALGTITSGKKNVGSLSAEVRVSDGQMNLVMGENAYLNGLEITPLSYAPTGFSYYELDFTKSTEYAYFSLNFSPTEDAVAYKIYHKESTDTEYTVMDTIPKEKVGDLHSYKEKLGGTYDFYVVGILADGTEGAPSSVLSIKMVDPSAVPPAAPAGLACTGAVDGSIALKWNPVAGAISYNVYRSGKAETDKGFKEYKKVATVDKNTTSFTDTGDDLTTNIHYYYKVQAVGVGGAGELSAALETPITSTLTRQPAETLTDRALVAAALAGSGENGQQSAGGVYLSWRLLKEDAANITFDIYKNDKLLKAGLQTTNYTDTDGKAGDVYYVAASAGVGSDASKPQKVAAWGNQYLELQLVKPEDQTMPDGKTCTYEANDTSVGDLDGDGQYELIVKWMPNNSQDNANSGYTGTTILDAYDFNTDGSVALMWRINLGVNIRSGAHYTQFQVFDADGDGIAEVACKTADGSTAYSYDGKTGKFSEIGHVGAVSADSLPTNTISAGYDYRNTAGRILSGPEYLTVFNGKTGRIMDTVDYDPGRGDVSTWGSGEAYGNRVDRFLAATAYLDGKKPSFVFCRGYYGKAYLTAYDYKGGKLSAKWKFTTEDYKDSGLSLEGQGNHNLNVNDIDGDGKDEIIYGSLVVDHDGTLKYCTGLGHGDALHVGDFMDSNPGLEILGVHENPAAQYGVEMHDAETGKILSGVFVGKDTGRGVAADIDPDYPGAEYWSGSDWDITNGGLYSSTSTVQNPVKISQNTPSVNFTVYWDGDLLKELLNHSFWKDDTHYQPLGVNITKWDYENKQEIKLFESSEVLSNNGTKGNPCLAADIMGDWRDEIIWRCAKDNSKIRIYTTTIPTDYSVPALMQDSAYRESVAWQNTAYNQPANLSYSLTQGLAAAQGKVTQKEKDSVSLQWTPASDGTYGHPVEGYEVYRTGEDGSYQLVDTLDTDGKIKGPADTGKEYKFDIGTAKGTQEGYIGIDASNQLYTAAQGYGFTQATVDSGLNYITKYGKLTDGEQALYNDFASAKAKASMEFLADVPNGEYEVTILYGVSSNGFKTVFKVENTADSGRCVSDGEKHAYQTKASVTDGQLTITASGSNAYPQISGIIIKPVSEKSGKNEDGSYYYKDSNVQSDTAYSYKIAAVVDGKTSFKSSAVQARTLVDIAGVPAITEQLVEDTPIPDGQTAASLLPTQVDVKNAKGDTVKADVTWTDISGLDITAPGTYTVKAKVAGWPDTLDATVTVVKNTIKGYAFADCTDGVYQLVENGKLNLPDTITILYQNGTSAQTTVQWNAAAVNNTKKGSYPVTGRIAIDESYTVNLTVSVVADYIVSVAPVATIEADIHSVLADSLPAMVSATYKSGLVKDAGITWDTDSVTTGSIASYTLTGHIAGYDTPVTAELRIVYPAVYKFDFGIDSSAVAPGYVGVTLNPKGGTNAALGAYSKEKGYGFTDVGGSALTAPVEGRDDKTFSPPYNDYAVAKNIEFKVDLPNGIYSVEFAAAYAYAKQTVSITAEGIAGAVSADKNMIKTGAVENVSVTDGQMNIVFVSNVLSRVPALVIRRVTSDAADRAVLDKAIADAKALTQADYTTESWSAMQDALAKAQACVPEASQGTVDSLAKALNDAIAALVKVPAVQPADRKALDKAIADAKALTQADYTTESWSAMQDAFAKAQACAPDASQEAVDSLAKALNDAIAALVKQEQPDNPQPPVPPATADVLRDTDTGVQVEAQKGVIADGAQLHVEKVGNGAEGFVLVQESLKDASTKFAAYNISLLVNGEKQQPKNGGELRITLPIPQDFDKENLAVFYVDDSGNKVEVSFTVAGDTVQFVTNHLSVYVLAEKDAAQTPSAEEQSSGTASTGDKTALAPFAVLFVSLIALGCIALMHRKKA